MNARILWSECKTVRAARLPNWVQLTLGGQLPHRVDAACARCGRRTYLVVRVDGKPESRCDWHLFDRLPFGIRKSSFGHVRRERQAS